jgi:hypothetical protein
MANDYVTLAEVKAALPLNQGPSSTTVYDALITSDITRVCRMFDKLTNRKPGAYAVSVDETRYYDGPGAKYSMYGLPTPVQGGYPADQRLGGGYWEGRSLWIDELAAAPTSVSVTPDGKLTNYQAWASTDYILWPYNALLENKPYLRLDLDILYGSHQVWWNFRRAVQIVGKFGFSTVCPDDIKQAILVQVARTFNRAMQNYQDTALVTDTAQLIYTKKMDPDLELMVNHYRRPAI